MTRTTYKGSEPDVPCIARSLRSTLARPSSLCLIHRNSRMKLDYFMAVYSTQTLYEGPLEPALEAGRPQRSSIHFQYPLVAIALGDLD